MSQKQQFQCTTNGMSPIEENSDSYNFSDLSKSFNDKKHSPPKKSEKYGDFNSYKLCFDASKSANGTAKDDDALSLSLALEKENKDGDGGQEQQCEQPNEESAKQMEEIIPTLNNSAERGGEQQSFKMNLIDGSYELSFDASKPTNVTVKDTPKFMNGAAKDTPKPTNTTVKDTPKCMNGAAKDDDDDGSLALEMEVEMKENKDADGQPQQWEQLYQASEKEREELRERKAMVQRERDELLTQLKLKEEKLEEVEHKIRNSLKTRGKMLCENNELKRELLKLKLQYGLITQEEEEAHKQLDMCLAVGQNEDENQTE